MPALILGRNKKSAGGVGLPAPPEFEVFKKINK
jgi:hypothetical protein